MNAKETAQMRLEFNNRIEELMQKKSANTVFFSKSDYDSLIKEYKEASIKTSDKTSLDYRRLKRYKIHSANGVERLISKKHGNDDQLVYFVHVEELFDIIHQCHVDNGHKRRVKMEMSLKGKYANVTREAISIYLDLCSVCAAKPARNLPKALKYSSGCGQFSLIEMQPEGDYRFVLNYQDSTSRFTHLRRLKSVQSCIAKKLLKIFLTFGLPSVLGSDLGLEFTNSVIASLKAMWPEGGKLQAGQAEKPNHEIRNSIKNWMQSTGCTSWTQSLPFVQWTINNSFHQAIGQTPFEALFGRKLSADSSTKCNLLSNFNSLTTIEVIPYETV